MEYFRIWWPRYLDPGSSTFLVGWINSTRRSVDVVVAAALSTSELQTSSFHQLEGFCGGFRVLGRSYGEVETESLRFTLSYKRMDDRCIPELERLEFEGKLLTPKVHIVFYEQPCFRSHHFSVEPWPSLCELRSSKVECKFDKPYWLQDLPRCEELSDVELVLRQLNCSGFIHSNESCEHSNLVLAGVRNMTVGVFASIATLYFMVGRLWTQVADWSLSLPVIGNLLRASTTFRILHMRFQEFTTWPLVLFWCPEATKQPNVAVAHRRSMLHHSAWSKLAVDLTLGAALGSLIFMFKSFITRLIVDTANFFTNDVLRTGCVWLMGVPAGFKLNNELAEFLGTGALDVIQAFSTLSVFWLPDLGSLLRYLALVSVLLGGTVSAALLVDILFLATAHITVLQRATALVYGNQLKMLAALWRMFRGRKHNPLRSRIDSYEYSVEQLVVASLMFTPLLLLLPTTSVFYTFFTILYMSLSVPRFLLQITVAGLSLFPYVETWLWLVARNRLPTGVQFRMENMASTKGMVAMLDSTTASYGEIVQPFMRRVCSRVNRRAVSNILYNLVSGGRLPLTVEFDVESLELSCKRTMLSVKVFFRMAFVI